MTTLFTAAVLLGAFLLFLVEPMSGKGLLPLLGATPAVWNTCLVFFQAALLAGYAYAHAATAWLGPQRRLALHAGLLLLPLPFLPLTAPSAAPPAQASPTVWLLQTLAASVGLPFIVLAAGGPLLQSWFSKTAHPRAQAPWFLFAASNFGSLLALLAYPTLVEPLLPLGAQGVLWSLGYATYAALVLACALQTRRALPAAPPGPASAARGAVRSRPGPRLGDVALWIALSAVPSSLTLGVTTYLATDVASLPLLWVVPLSLYLLTFVAAFSRVSAAATDTAVRLLPMQALLVALLIVGRLAIPLALALLLHLLVFTVASLACHGRLARARPGVEHLTTYYLAIAFGGMLGGAWNALVAPALFPGVVEYPLAIVLACALLPGPRVGEGRLRWVRWGATPVLVGVLALAIVLGANRVEVDARLLAAALAVPVLLAYALASRPLRFATALGLMLLAGTLAGGRWGPAVHAERTFFGVYRIHEDPVLGRRALMHGTTLHGMQDLEPSRRREPLAYYHRSGPLGQALAVLPAASGSQIAVVGLGAGAVASYAQPGQSVTFFEIDPAVERMARDTGWFSYLSDCGPRCTVIVGDARLSLARAPEGAYDVIVLDAFSSDAIPVHLVTREAFELYCSRLAPGGAILVHFGNRHLALAPVLARVAHAHRLSALAQHDAAPYERATGRMPSEWMVMVRDARDLGPLIVDSRWTPVGPSPEAPLWTDDFSSLARVLRLRSPARPR
jgi:hypothetical protein